MWVENPPHTMFDIPNVTAWLQAEHIGDRSTAAPTSYTFSGVLTYLHRACYKPATSFFQSPKLHLNISPSGTLFLHGIINLRQQLFVMRSQICCLWNTPTQQILDVLLSKPYWVLKWGQQWIIQVKS